MIRISDENANRLLSVLDELDAHFREHQSTMRPRKEDIMAGGRLLLMTRAGPLGVLGFIGDDERYEDLIDASSNVSMTTGSIRVLGLEELIRQKRLANRQKDQAALALLEEVLRRRDGYE